MQRALGRARAILGGSSGQLVLASIGARLAVLVFLVGAARLVPNKLFEHIVFVIAITTAAQVLLAPNALSSFVLADWAANPSRSVATWRRVCELQLLASFLVFVSPVAIAYAMTPTSDVLTACISLGALAAIESAVRFFRVVWQSASMFKPYAAVDWYIAGGRIVSLLGLAALGPSVGLPLGAGLAALLLAAKARPSLSALNSPPGTVEAAQRNATGVSRLEIAGAVAPYVGGMFFVAVYAQAPPIIIGLTGSLRDAALYSIATRLTQPTELVPIAISSTLLPTLIKTTDRRERLQRFKAGAGTAVRLGLVTAIALLIASPAYFWAFGIGMSTGSPLIAILLIALPFKFYNYQVVAYATALGEMGRRMAIAGAIALTSAVSVTLASPYGAYAVSAVAVGCELGLFASLYVTIVRRQDTRKCQ